MCFQGRSVVLGRTNENNSIQFNSILLLLYRCDNLAIIIYSPKFHTLRAQKVARFKVWRVGEIDMNLHIFIGSTFVTLLYIPPCPAVFQCRPYPQGNLVTIPRKKESKHWWKIKWNLVLICFALNKLLNTATLKYNLESERRQVIFRHCNILSCY